MDNLKKEIDLGEIDFIVANHAEIDHSGALPHIMKEIPDTPIYCTENGIKSLKGHFHRDWDFRPVKTGDSLELGNKELVFVEAPMLHWPDSMFSYLTEDAVLFSNDAFGQHYATERLFADLADQEELAYECIKYYANILTPFSALVKKKIQEVLDLKLPVSMVATSHGVIWRKNPLHIVEQYMKWADAYQEDQVTLLYDTMWQGTRILAEQIAHGIAAEAPNTEIKLLNTARSDKNDVITEVFRSKAVCVGSPTINRGILTSVAGILEEIRGLGFKKKKGVAFGCYGWSGEGVGMLTEDLEKAGFELLDDGFKAMWNPDEEAKTGAVEYGKKLAKLL
jgi:flavorubredoxin